MPSFYRLARPSRLAVAAATLIAVPAVADDKLDPSTLRLDQMVVTAAGRSEPLSQTASTIQVISEERIRNSSAKSVTDLLAENAVGFFSEWTPGQTSINIRGASTEGQGRDYRSAVTVLLNGRRAGTANISKLSLADVERIEIIRGPASVIYGSQAMGGVVNIITRNGQNTEGRFFQATTGSWGLAQGNAYAAGKTGPADYYAGLSGGRRDSYYAGKGAPEAPLSNTDWQRYGGLAAIGYDFDQRNHLEVTMRSDGIYDAGFRGSQWSNTSKDDRYNQSAEAIYTGSTADGIYRWTGQVYYYRDIDDLGWSAPRQRTGAVGNIIDDNTRKQTAFGMKLVPEFRLAPKNTLLTGIDAEQSKLDSTRFIQRFATAGLTAQIAPLDNNERDTAFGIYAEDVQKLFDDRLTLRGGARYSWGHQQLLATPNQPLLRLDGRDYDQATYSAGAAVLATDWLKLRTGVATGFRAPTGSELAASFTSLGGSQTLGNASLKPESSVQYEIGTTLTSKFASLDLALFQNTISDRIATQVINAATSTSQYFNNAGDVVVRGLEAQAEFDVAGQFDLPMVARLFTNAVWNFDMDDKGASTALNPSKRYNKVQRMYYYQGTVGGTFGMKNVFDIRPLGILRGPMFYNTEEDLLATYKPNSSYVSRKDPYWTWNMRGNYYPTDGVTVFGAVNNIFDVNKSPVFISTDSLPYEANPRGSNGGLGNSQPGREFLVGVQVTF